MLNMLKPLISFVVLPAFYKNLHKQFAKAANQGKLTPPSILRLVALIPVAVLLILAPISRT
jgi:uncharacterized membrane protein